MKLLSCPFCGSTYAPVVKISKMWSLAWILCRVKNGGCGARSGQYDDREKAIAAWNQRRL